VHKLILSVMTVCMDVCRYLWSVYKEYTSLCVSVYVMCVQYMFCYPSGDLNLNAHRLMGTRVTV